MQSNYKNEYEVESTDFEDVPNAKLYQVIEDYRKTKTTESFTSLKSTYPAIWKIVDFTLELAMDLIHIVNKAGWFFIQGFSGYLLFQKEEMMTAVKSKGQKGMTLKVKAAKKIIVLAAYVAGVYLLSMILNNRQQLFQ